MKLWALARWVETRHLLRLRTVAAGGRTIAITPLITPAPAWRATCAMARGAGDAGGNRFTSSAAAGVEAGAGGRWWASSGGARPLRPRRSPPANGGGGVATHSDGWVNGTLKRVATSRRDGELLGEGAQSELLTALSNVRPDNAGTPWRHFPAVVNALIASDAMTERVGIHILAACTRLVQRGGGGADMVADLLAIGRTVFHHLQATGAITAEAAPAKYAALLGSAGDVTTMLHVLHATTQALGITPSPHFFNDCMKATAAASRYDLLLQLYDSMVDLKLDRHIATRKVLAWALRQVVMQRLATPLASPPTHTNLPPTVSEGSFTLTPSDGQPLFTAQRFRHQFSAFTGMRTLSQSLADEVAGADGRDERAQQAGIGDAGTVGASPAVAAPTPAAGAGDTEPQRPVTVSMEDVVWRVLTVNPHTDYDSWQLRVETSLLALRFALSAHQLDGQGAVFDAVLSRDLTIAHLGATLSHSEALKVMRRGERHMRAVTAQLMRQGGMAGGAVGGMDAGMGGDVHGSEAGSPASLSSAAPGVTGGRLEDAGLMSFFAEVGRTGEAQAPGGVAGQVEEVGGPGVGEEGVTETHSAGMGHGPHDATSAAINARCVTIIQAVRWSFMQAAGIDVHRPAPPRLHRTNLELAATFTHRLHAVLRAMVGMGVVPSVEVAGEAVALIIQANLPHVFTTLSPYFGDMFGSSAAASERLCQVLKGMASPPAAATIFRLLPQMVAMGVHLTPAVVNDLIASAMAQWRGMAHATCPACLTSPVAMGSGEAPRTGGPNPPPSPSPWGGPGSDGREGGVPTTAITRGRPRDRLSPDQWRCTVLAAVASPASLNPATSGSTTQADVWPPCLGGADATTAVFPSQQIRLLSRLHLLQSVAPETWVAMAHATAAAPCGRESWNVWVTMRRLGLPQAHDPDLLRAMLHAFVSGRMLSAAWEVFALLYPRHKGPLPTLARLQAALGPPSAPSAAPTAPPRPVLQKSLVATMAPPTPHPNGQLGNECRLSLNPRWVAAEYAVSDLGGGVDVAALSVAAQRALGSQLQHVVGPALASAFPAFAVSLKLYTTPARHMPAAAAVDAASPPITRVHGLRCVAAGDVGDGDEGGVPGAPVAKVLPFVSYRLSPGQPTTATPSPEEVTALLRAVRAELVARAAAITFHADTGSGTATITLRLIEAAPAVVNVMAVQPALVNGSTGAHARAMEHAQAQPPPSTAAMVDVPSPTAHTSTESTTPTDAGVRAPEQPGEPEVGVAAPRVDGGPSGEAAGSGDDTMTDWGGLGDATPAIGAALPSVAPCATPSPSAVSVVAAAAPGDMTMVHVPGLSNQPMLTLTAATHADAKLLLAGLFKLPATWDAVERRLLAGLDHAMPTPDAGIAVRLKWRAAKQAPAHIAPGSHAHTLPRVWSDMPVHVDGGSGPGREGTGGWGGARETPAPWPVAHVVPQFWFKTAGSGKAHAEPAQVEQARALVASIGRAWTSALDGWYRLEGRATDGHTLEVAFRVGGVITTPPPTASAPAPTDTPAPSTGAVGHGESGDTPSAPTPTSPSSALAGAHVISVVNSRKHDGLLLQFHPPLPLLAMCGHNATLPARWAATPRSIRTQWRAAIAQALQPRLDVVREAHSSFFINLQWDDDAITPTAPPLAPATSLAAPATPPPLPKPGRVKVTKYSSSDGSGSSTEEVVAGLAARTAASMPPATASLYTLGTITPKVQLLRRLPNTDAILTSQVPLILRHLLQACSPLRIGVVLAGAAKGGRGNQSKPGRKQRAPPPPALHLSLVPHSQADAACDIKWQVQWQTLRTGSADSVEAGSLSTTTAATPPPT